MAWLDKVKMRSLLGKESREKEHSEHLVRAKQKDATLNILRL